MATGRRSPPDEIEMGVFLCTFGGALAGIFIRAVLPAHHFGDDAKGSVNVAAAMGVEDLSVGCEWMRAEQGSEPAAQ